MGEDFLASALSGAIGSSPVAAVLVWRLLVSDKRVKHLEERMDMMHDQQLSFMKDLATLSSPPAEE